MNKEHTHKEIYIYDDEPLEEPNSPQHSTINHGIWEYDDEPLEEPKNKESKEDNTPQFKTPSYTLRAIRRYEEKIRADKEKFALRTHQKKYSAAKSFLFYDATLAELDEMTEIIKNVKEWAKKIKDFHEIPREQRKELYQKDHRSSPKNKQ